MKNMKRKLSDWIKKVRHEGFTLVEVILAIVIIAISIPSIMIPFSGLRETKRPDVVVRASFLAQEIMERMANRQFSDIDAECTAIDADATYPAEFGVACAVTDVAADNPDSTAGTFAKKIVVTITHENAGTMEFYNLFGL